NLEADVTHRLDNAFGNQITAHNATEDIDQNGFDVGTRSNQLERLGDTFGRGAATDIEKIGRRAAVQLDQIHGAHGQTGTVDHAANVTVELNVGQVVFGRLRFALVFLAGIAHGGIVLVPKQRVVVQIQLAVEGD